MSLFYAYSTPMLKIITDATLECINNVCKKIKNKNKKYILCQNVLIF